MDNARRKGRSMKRIVALLLFGMVLSLGAAVYAEEQAGAPVAEEHGDDGRVIRKCPRGGEPLVFGHEHLEEAEAAPIIVGMDNSFYNKYIWRGINLNDDPVWQPAVWANYKNLTLNVWASYDLTDFNGQVGNITEVDYTLDYSWAWDKVHCSVGGIHY